MKHRHAVLLGFVLGGEPLWVTAQALPPGYVGSQTCNGCHEDIYNGIAKSPHHLVDTDKKRGWDGRACEACHGPGQKHAESADATLIQNPAKLTAAATDKICLNCHLNTPTHVGRLESSHARNQISCTACHNVHSSEPLVVRNSEATNKLCASCHLNE
jgi:predicted CXXCH cytochrome family protein